jgi:hypothetical protein
MADLRHAVFTAWSHAHPAEPVAAPEAAPVAVAA